MDEDRIAKERLEKERLEKEKLEKERLEKEKKERLEKERLEKEKLEKERLEKEKKEKLEKERLEKEKLEKERLEKEKLEKERLEKEKLEKEKLETRNLPTESEEERQKQDNLRLKKTQEEVFEEEEEKLIRPATSFQLRKVQELEKCMAEYTGHKMLVVIKGPPDPDSIACAWAHSFIAQNFGIESQILYFNPISHPENRALVKALRVELVQYTPGMDLSQFSCYALVDTQSEDFPAINELPKDTLLFSLVDHHKKTGKVKARFIDIREHAGACSSIYAEYLQYGKHTLIASSAADTELATALHHGIRTDTDNFFLAREIDWQAAAYLSRFADRDLLRQIASPSVSANTMDILQHGLANKEIKDNYLFAGVGFVREVDRDSIAQVADYMVRREGIDTAIVFGIVEEKYIHGSLRTRSTTVDPDSFLKDVLGTDQETGKHYGGGRFDKGGFQISLSIFGETVEKDLLWELVSKTIKAKFMKKLGGKPQFRHQAES